MDPKVVSVLDAYHARIEEERPRMAALGRAGTLGDVIDQFLLAVGPDTGQLLHILVRTMKAPHVLELGTSYGYSTLWLADAARAAGGRVTTMELSPEKSKYARDMATRAGVDGVVDFRVGDAVQMIPTLPHGIDFVLVDLWKDLSIPCLEGFYPKLNAGAVAVADNMLEPPMSAPAMAEYARAIRAKPGIASVLLAVGSGIEVSRLTG
jgi:predicted O-methyltransferase YrrM